MNEDLPDVSATDASSTSAPQAQEPVTSTEPTGDKGYLDAVMSALEKPVEGSQPSEPDQKQPTAKPVTPTDEQKPQDADDPTEDELKNYSPHARKRIGQLLGQRKEFREQAERLASEVEPLKARAKVAEDLQSFVQASGLTKEDLDAGFSIMAMMRGDPQRALAALMPIVQELQSKTGNVLPDDLQNDVREGKITVAHALELSRARAGMALTKEQQAEAAERQRAESQRTAFQQAVTAASTAVSEWERTKAGSDPDWHLKSERIAQLVELEVHRKGFPTDPVAAVELHKRALDTVNAEMRKLRPTPKPMQMASGHASPNSVTEPKSYMEAALMGLALPRS